MARMLRGSLDTVSSQLDSGVKRCRGIVARHGRGGEPHRVAGRAPRGAADGQARPGAGRGAGGHRGGCWPRARSYAELNVERIAKAAGISRTAFYFYFRDKRDLLMRLAADVTEQLYAQADIWFSGERRPRAARSARRSRSIAELYHEHGVLIRAIVEVSDLRGGHRDVLARPARPVRRRDRAAHRGRAGPAPAGARARHRVRADLDGRAHLLPAARAGRALADGRARRRRSPAIYLRTRLRRADGRRGQAPAPSASNSPVSICALRRRRRPRPRGLGPRAADAHRAQAAQLEDLQHVDEVDAGGHDQQRERGDDQRPARVEVAVVVGVGDEAQRDGEAAEHQRPARTGRATVRRWLKPMRLKRWWKWLASAM